MLFELEQSLIEKGKMLGRWIFYVVWWWRRILYVELIINVQAYVNFLPWLSFWLLPNRNWNTKILSQIQFYLRWKPAWLLACLHLGDILYLHYIFMCYLLLTGQNESFVSTVIMILWNLNHWNRYWLVANKTI